MVVGRSQPDGKDVESELHSADTLAQPLGSHMGVQTCLHRSEMHS